ncbi:restriction endonuclease [Halomonas sp. OfavH-34-E]|uniref:restriction endonuclease n=1 Tax=Halomonas sp. OfavH-34-E TaxID=2954491 RepID=UPI002096E751|nr:restriction endonuclease [Halomonas sp. OfavH-34-E]MCO7217581.1 restriction endonuclease [Halomonas sp. OfavH-34-E]
MSEVQEEIKKLVMSGEITLSSLENRKQILQNIQEFESEAWTIGFCKEISLTAEDNFLPLLKLDDVFLKHVGIHSVLLKKFSSKLEEHLPILLSKKDRAIRCDEFGDTISKGWFSYLEKYYKDKIEPFIHGAHDSIDSELFEHFETTRLKHLVWYEINKGEVIRATLKNIDFFIEFNRENTTTPDINISGTEYESRIASQINKETTWDAELTKASGDQGADIILSKSQLTIIVQTKYHSSKIGNSAVQEAFSAKKYYGADLAFVVSNSGFTKSASELADATGVRLFSDVELMSFLS